MARTNQAAIQKRADDESEDKDVPALVPVEDEELRTREAAERDEPEESAEEQEEDTRLGGQDTGSEEADTERERKREERRAKRHRQKDSVNRAFRELRFLRGRNEQLERRFSEVDMRFAGAEAGNIDNQLRDIDTKIEQATQVIALASKSDAPTSGQDMAEAMRIRDQLMEAKYTLRGARQNTEYRAQAIRNTPPAPDPAVVDFARNWIAANPWYSMQGGMQGTDPDSVVVMKIDTALKNEGYDPASENYWQELQSRVNRHPALRDHAPTKRTRQRDPDADEDDDDEPEADADHQTSGNGRDAQHRGGPRFTSGGRERPLRKGEFYVSPERKAAMIEAGVWEDDKLRKKMLARYAEYDRDAGRNRA